MTRKNTPHPDSLPNDDGSRVAAPVTRKAVRWGLRALVAIGLVMVGLAGVIGLLGQESSTRWIIGQIPGLTAEGVRGPLFGGRFVAKRLQWQGTAKGATVTLDDVVVDGLHWRWLPRANAWLRVEIDALSARRVAYRSGAPSPSRAPLTPPASLALPIELLVSKLSVDELQINDAAPAHSLRARLHFGAEDGLTHEITAVSASWDRFVFEGNAWIETTAPLNLQAALTARTAGSAPSLPLSAKLNADGPLAKLPLTLAMQGQAKADQPAPMLDARATVAPFAAWPIDALELATRDLDLAALIDGAPASLLSGTALLRAPSAKEPVHASISLSNALAGKWNEGRLPVRSLTLELGGELEHRDRVDIAGFDIMLGNDREGAGQWSGSGDWVGDKLVLQTRLVDVRPQRLDKRAAALMAKGPLVIKAQGLPSPDPRTPRPDPLNPKVDLQATLAGRLDARAGIPLRIALTGSGERNRVEISQFNAQAGAARFEGVALAAKAGNGWQLRSRGEGAGFDPSLWWPGEEGSAWRRGPHRFNGHWTADLLLPDAPRQPQGLALLRALRGDAELAITDSVFAGVALQSTLALKARAGAPSEFAATASVEGNGAKIDGRLVSAAQLAAGAPDKFDIDLRAPRLAALAPLSAFAPPALAAWAPRRGSLSAQASASGAWPALVTQGDAEMHDLQLGDVSLQRGDAHWRLGASSDAPLALTLQIDDLQRGKQRIDQLRASLDGTLRAHTLQLDASSPLRPPAWTEALLGASGTGSLLQLRASGEWLNLRSALSREAKTAPARDRKTARGIEPTATAATATTTATATTNATAADAAIAIPLAGDAYIWRAKLPLLRGSARGNASATPWIAATDLAFDLHFDAAGQLNAANAAPGRIEVPASALRWSRASWQRAQPTPRIDVDAQLEPIAVASLLAKLQPDFGWTGDLKVSGRAIVRSGERFDADVVVERSGGDLRVTESGVTQTLGLSDMRFAMTAKDGLWQFSQAVAGGNFGAMAGAQVIRTSPQRIWPDPQAPLEGVLEMRVANLGAWGAWVPPGWRLAGSLRTSASFGGRFGAPEITGEMRGTDIGVRNVLQGVSLTDGDVAITLSGSQAQIERFTLHAGDGLLTLSGGATFGAQPEAQVRLAAQKFQVLGRADRRIIVSGSADMVVRADSLKLDGDAVVDEGLIDFSRAGAPALDGDVVVIRNEAAPPPEIEPVPVWLRDSVVSLRVNLGEKLRVRGRGLNTTLRGDLRVATPAGRPSIQGTVRTVAGTYVAYAQNLEIERGEIAFSGVPDNPRLDILAIRPNLDVKVGVAVAGTAQNPRVRLVSEPEMADFDKMSWLVLGRASDGLGRADTALLQRAAVALLSGEGSSPTDNFLNQIGLTDFSLRQTEPTAQGQTAETVVSLGRQLSQRWYLGYERSVNATTGTWQLIYRAARRFTLRAQSGEDTSLDLIWSWRW